MDNSVIVAKNIVKYFNPSLGSSTLKTALVDLVKGRKSESRQPHKVLQGVDITVGRGEFVGVIGRNGSGKSTLLKTLAGVYTADSGSLQINGTLTPFIELGVGFNPELTGRDNIYLNGALLGFSRRVMDSMYDDIVEFAELSEFMDEKLKNYSSGMQVRLAFSIAIKVNSDILLIDEVLAVGDVKFQKKCYDVFNSFKESGKTVVFVSHAMPQVEEFCDRTIVLADGKILFDGNTKEAVKIYDDLNAPEKKKTVVKEAPKSYRSGNGKAVIDDFRFKEKSIKVGDALELTLDVVVKKDISDLHLGISLYRKDRAQSIFAITEPLSAQSQEISLVVDELNLTPGAYFVSFGLSKGPDSWKDHYDLLEKQASFTIKSRNKSEVYNLGPAHIGYKVKKS